MTIKKNNYKKQSSLLKELLSFAHVERESLGRELHASKAYLNELAIIIGRIERMSSIQQLDLNIIDEQKQVINDFRGVLQDIRTRIYPPLINLSGILVGIKQFVVDYQKENPVNVELEYDDNTKEYLSTVKDLSIYKTCIIVIDYLFSCGIREMRIKLMCDGKKIEFDAIVKLRRLKLNEDELAKMLRNVEAHLIWSDAVTGRETNWKDRFKIKFPI